MVLRQSCREEGLFFLMPVLNTAAKNLEERAQRTVLVSVFLLFSVLPLCFNNDVFKTHDGYSVLWLIIMYLAGGYLKRFGVPFRKYRSYMPVLYLLCIGLTWAELVRGGTGTANLLKYTSPTIVIAALALLVWAEGLDIGASAGRLISILAAGSFGVYLIHDNPLVRTHVVSKYVSEYNNLSVVRESVAVIVTAVGIYMVCAGIDGIRRSIFRTCRTGIISLVRFVESMI